MPGETFQDIPVLLFATPQKWEAWLAKNHPDPKGIWMRIAKKDSEETSVTYAEALDGALCYGWIDGQKQKYDEVSWLQKFTPRRPKSPWSKINTGHAERLIKTGKMKAAGLRQIEEAKKDGRWHSAYDSHGTFTIPADFLKEVNKNKKAKAFFKTLSRVNLYALAYRLQTAKRPETREKRMKTYLEMLKQGKSIHPTGKNDHPIERKKR